MNARQLQLHLVPAPEPADASNAPDGSGARSEPAGTPPVQPTGLRLPPVAPAASVTSAPATYPPVMPFGVTGLRGWTLRLPDPGSVIPTGVVQLRLYALLRALEARADPRPACITGVQGTRIMRLVALLSVAPAAGHAVALPFGTRCLRDWVLSPPGGRGILPVNAARLRLYIQLSALEARAGGRPVRITGVQGVRIMRLVALMAPPAGCAAALPFGGTGLHGWRLAMSGGDLPAHGNGWTRRGGQVPAHLYAPAPATMRRNAQASVRRAGLGTAACTLGALGCLTWLTCWLVSREADLPGLLTLPARPAALSPAHAPPGATRTAATVAGPADRLADRSIERSMEQLVDASVDQLVRRPASTQWFVMPDVARPVVTAAVRPGVVRHRLAPARRASPVPVQAAHRRAIALTAAAPVHAGRPAPQRKAALPDGLRETDQQRETDWEREDYEALTGGGNRPRARVAAPADPTQWAQHVTQRRLTEIPDEFGH